MPADNNACFVAQIVKEREINSKPSKYKQNRKKKKKKRKKKNRNGKQKRKV